MCFLPMHWIRSYDISASLVNRRITALCASLYLSQMKEVLQSPEKQLAEVVRHPYSVLGLNLDMAFLKAVCNGSMGA